MNPALAVVLTILGLVGTGMGVYYMARSNTRENARLQAQRVTDAVNAATAPLREQLATANQTILRQDRAAERQQTRIEQLEDDLRRMP